MIQVTLLPTNTHNLMKLFFLFWPAQCAHRAQPGVAGRARGPGRDWKVWAGHCSPSWHCCGAGGWSGAGRAGSSDSRTPAPGVRLSLLPALPGLLHSPRSTAVPAGLQCSALTVQPPPPGPCPQPAGRQH